MISEIYLINMRYSVITVFFITVTVDHGKSFAFNECRHRNIAKNGKFVTINVIPTYN